MQASAIRSRFLHHDLASLNRNIHTLQENRNQNFTKTCEGLVMRQYGCSREVDGVVRSWRLMAISQEGGVSHGGSVGFVLLSPPRAYK